MFDLSRLADGMLKKSKVEKNKLVDELTSSEVQRDKVIDKFTSNDVERGKLAA